MERLENTIIFCLDIEENDHVLPINDTRIKVTQMALIVLFRPPSIYRLLVPPIYTFFKEMNAVEKPINEPAWQHLN